MRKYKIFLYELIGFFVVFILGSVNHFVYDFSNKNAIVGLFVATNESTWEHLKLLFFPFLIFTIAEYYILEKDYNNFFLYKLFGALLGLVFIVIGFYLYSGILGHSYVPVDIIIFILGVAFSFYYSHQFIVENPIHSNYNYIGVTGLIILTLLFLLFTYLPPAIPLFVSPV